MKKYKAWAIDTGEGRLIGRYWWNDQRIPDHMKGHINACWETRREARDVVRYIRRAYPKAKVVRVNVTVTW